MYPDPAVWLIGLVGSADNYTRIEPCPSNTPLLIAGLKVRGLKVAKMLAS